jgi:short-subunit dehydrogenase
MNYSLILGGTAGLGLEIYKQSSAASRHIVVGRRMFEPLSKNDIYLPVDLSLVADVNRLIKDLEDLTKNLNITDFFWVAGVLHRKPSLQIKADEILDMVDVNLRHPLLLASWVWQHMNASQINCRYTVISSTVGVSSEPRDDEAVYSAVKSAQVSFARAIGKQNKNSSKQVSLFCPGGMQTDFWKRNPVDPTIYSTFLNPTHVATKILTVRSLQSSPYLELIIPRGSL